jgi:peptide chain release factor 2
MGPESAQQPLCPVPLVPLCWWVQARLLLLAQKQQLKEISEIRGDMVKAEWGQQIRNYVFHPYSLVKDLRTSQETSNVGGVMDGDLDDFVLSYLRHKGRRQAEG